MKAKRLGRYGKKLQRCRRVRIGRRMVTVCKVKRHRRKRR